MINTKEQARQMYMSGNYSQRDIAKELCISERTVYNWIQNNTWDKLRQAAFAAPAIIAHNLCNQLVELQNAIAAREPGQRFPTLQEAAITGKLISGIEKMKKYPSLPQNMQVLETFKQYVSPKVDRKFNRDLKIFTDGFLQAEAKNGFSPYQIEYQTEGAAPLNPFLADHEQESENVGTAEQEEAVLEPYIEVEEESTCSEDENITTTVEIVVESKPEILATIPSNGPENKQIEPISHDVESRKMSENFPQQNIHSRLFDLRGRRNCNELNIM
ncbi:MAG: helix-turn-helix domain-containing protein [Taibaiella sp.]|nr:helix-turn-helix domain-containing protein [Taibaiella sp.]